MYSCSLSLTNISNQILQDRMSDCCSTPSGQFFCDIIMRTSYQVTEQTGKWQSISWCKITTQGSSIPQGMYIYLMTDLFL